MNWSKIKNIMIFILVAVNLFLIADISVMHYSSTALPEGTGESFKKVLEKNNIELEGYLVPKYYETRKVIEAEFYDIDFLTKAFLNGQPTYVSQSNAVTAKVEGRSLTVSDIIIEYTREGNGVEKNGDDIIKALKKAGISTTGAKFVKNEGLVRVFLDDILVEGVYLDVKLSEEGEIMYLKGVWPKISVTNATEKVSVISSVKELCQTIPQGSCIDGIEKIYITKGDNKNCTITPGWKISCEGKSYTVN